MELLDKFESTDLRLFSQNLSEGEEFSSSGSASHRFLGAVLVSRQEVPVTDAEPEDVKRALRCPDPLSSFPDLRSRRSKSRSGTVLRVNSLSDENDSDHGGGPENYPSLHLQFPGLPGKIGGFLKMGGRAFEMFF